MFKITDRETNQLLTIEPQSKIELTFSEEWISVNLSVWSRDHHVSINSEWLTMKMNALPKNDLNFIGELNFEETTESEVIITGPYAHAFRTGDDMGFYYYYNQSLFPEHSQSKLRSLKNNMFHFKHQSVVDFFSFEVDVAVPLTTLSARAWYDEPNPQKRIEELKQFFLDHFDAALYGQPEIEDTGTCFLLTYKAV